MISTLVKAVTAPYETLDELATRRDAGPALRFIILLGVAMGLASLLLQSGEPSDRILQAVLSSGLIVLTYFLAVGAFTLVSRLTSGEGDYRTYLSIWGLSYIPTAVWFLGMLGFHAAGAVFYGAPGLLPRTFILVFWTFSVTMFFWKLLFYFLTLRIGGNMNSRQMICSSLLLAPVALAYWSAVSMLGFKVPFI